jgi:hypothetical protein
VPIVWRLRATSSEDAASADAGSSIDRPEATKALAGHPSAPSAGYLTVAKSALRCSAIEENVLQLPDEFVQALAALLHDRRMPLTRRPILLSAIRDDRRPYPVAFKRWAEIEALDFHCRFGELASITVGGRPYPGPAALRP